MKVKHDQRVAAGVGYAMKCFFRTRICLNSFTGKNLGNFDN
jgi:hypothetical protein